MNSVKRYLKLIGLIGAALILLAVLDLYTLQLLVKDPGPYVVARRSDSPSQVHQALVDMKRNNFRNREKLKVLYGRYLQKLRHSDTKQPERKKWMQALKTTVRLLEQTDEESTSDSAAP